MKKAVICMMFMMFANGSQVHGSTYMHGGQMCQPDHHSTDTLWIYSDFVIAYDGTGTTSTSFLSVTCPMLSPSADSTDVDLSSDLLVYFWDRNDNVSAEPADDVCCLGNVVNTSGTKLTSSTVCGTELYHLTSIQTITVQTDTFSDNINLLNATLQCDIPSKQLGNVSGIAGYKQSWI